MSVEIRNLDYMEALNAAKQGNEDMSLSELLEREVNDDKPTIDFDTLIDDCVRFIDVVGYVLTLDGKSHTFDNTSEIVPFVQDELGYVVVF